ncbi:MAG: hypothetical protein Ct9H300mP8_09150 [Gammaproteobacteria bacterium]|nr:MAG: hypothetical protein Ct9H300mP8_09150 [Gammaproteobacteria bacterium]
MNIAATITGITNTAAMPERISRPLRCAGVAFEFTFACVFWDRTKNPPNDEYGQRHGKPLEGIGKMPCLVFPRRGPISNEAVGHGVVEQQRRPNDFHIKEFRENPGKSIRWTRQTPSPSARQSRRLVDESPPRGGLLSLPDTAELWAQVRGLVTVEDRVVLQSTRDSRGVQICFGNSIRGVDEVPDSASQRLIIE